MHFLVAYVVHPSGSQRRLLQGVFGDDFRGSFLPVTSRQFESHIEAQAKLQELRAAMRGPDEDVLIQPGDDELPSMSEESALGLLKRHDAWGELLENFHSSEGKTRIKSKEHPRCWVLVVTIPGAQIPPGEAFLVDKHSGHVFPRRYVDAISSDGEPL
jgi:hypothetical protein